MVWFDLPLYVFFWGHLYFLKEIELELINGSEVAKIIFFFLNFLESKIISCYGLESIVLDK